MNTQREVIWLEDESEFSRIIYEDHEDFTEIQQIKGYFDSEKGYVEMTLIVQRNEDGKFFKLNYRKWGAGRREIDKLCLTQVFEKEKTVKYYE